MEGLDESASPGSPCSVGSPLSNLQWYLDRSRNVVYFAAESKGNLSESELENITQCFLDLAPQLASKIDRNLDQHVRVKISTKAFYQFERTTDLQRSLDEKLRNLHVIFGEPDCPSLRAFGFQVEDPQPGQAGSLILILSTHALMEGSDTARIVRCRPNPDTQNQLVAPLRMGARAAVFCVSKALATMHLAASALKKSDEDTRRWTVLDLDRKHVQRLAKRLKVRTRSVLFSLILFGLRPTSSTTGKRQKPQTVGYSMVPSSKEKVGDAALQFRMQIGRFTFADHFEDFVQLTDALMAKENITEKFGPALYDSILGFHRRLNRIFPFLYGKRFFNFVPYDFVLSLVPPHFTSGPLRSSLDGSIFCGSNSPGVNCCVIVPHRSGFSLNLSLDADAHERRDRLTALLDECEISYRRAV